MARELKVVGFLNGERLDGPIPQEACEIMMQNLSRTMSAYYSQHPEEYAALCKEEDEREAAMAAEKE